MSQEQAIVVMLDMLARTVAFEAVKALVWAAVFTPVFYLTIRKR